MRKKILQTIFHFKILIAVQTMLFQYNDLVLLIIYLHNFIQIY